MTVRSGFACDERTDAFGRPAARWMREATGAAACPNVAHGKAHARRC
jgi:hypothetical protein